MKSKSIDTVIIHSAPTLIHQKMAEKQRLWLRVPEPLKVEKRDEDYFLEAFHSARAGQFRRFSVFGKLGDERFGRQQQAGD